MRHQRRLPELFFFDLLRVLFGESPEPQGVKPFRTSTVYVAMAVALAAAVLFWVLRFR